MIKDKSVLLIGTNEIDCFFGLANLFDKKGARVIQVHSNQMLDEYLSEKSFDIIFVNLEPDGLGGIRGIDILPKIIESHNNQEAICFSVSTESATALLTADAVHLNALSIVVGWLTLPIEHSNAVNLIEDIVTTPNSLSVKNRHPI